MLLTFFFLKLVHGGKVNIDIELRFRNYEFYFGVLVANDHYFRPKLYYIQVQINGNKNHNFCHRPLLYPIKTKAKHTKKFASCKRKNNNNRTKKKKKSQFD